MTIKSKPYAAGLYFLLLLLISFSCTSKQESKEDTFFTKKNPLHTKITFSNDITENDTLNYFNFPYLYLGAGVAVGDINNDGLPDLYFTGNQVPNKLYLNKGNLVFEDITVSAGIQGDQRWYSGVTMVDINHDGWLDLYLSVSGKSDNTSNQLFVNNGDNTFSEQASNYGIADKGISIQSTFFDYDNDGHLDLFVANYPNVRVSAGNRYYKEKMDENRHEDSGHLYRNNGDGTFTDVTEEAGLRRFGLSLGLVASDFNNDGFKDLYLSNDFNVPDYLYQNNGDGTFTEISKLATRHTSMFGMGIDAGDFNNDGFIDLVQLDMTPEDYKRAKTNMASMNPKSFYEGVDMGFHYQYMQNALQVNNGNSKNGQPIFSDISRLAGIANTDWSWGAVFADLNNDGWKDIFITNGVKRDVNNNDVNQQFESANFFGREKNPDYQLMPSTPLSNYGYLNNKDFTFTNNTQAWGLDELGFSNGFVTSDLDNDGDLDLAINNLDETASIYANESQISEQHYLKVSFNGPEHNPLGLGTKVKVIAGNLVQHQELTLTRGYQSSMEPKLHFGLGKIKLVNEVELIWPDGLRQKLVNIHSDQELVLNYRDATATSNDNLVQSSTFEDVSDRVGANFKHIENVYDDYQFEPLLPHKYSQIGPALAVGDVNGDGLDDFFVGNASGNKAAMFTQDKFGHFGPIKGPWEEDSLYEDTGALLFDADNDGDKDLYVVSGGYNKLLPSENFKDRLYINLGNKFEKSTSSIPAIVSSGSVVIQNDFDQDGDLDLFVAGRTVPGKYPFPARSHILQNQGGKDNSLRFVDITKDLAPELLSLGLVTSALWEDFDGDGKTDLILTGEWMPIRFFKNQGASFVEVTKKLGTEKDRGWWYSLHKTDLDGDGDTDLLAGNLGQNYKYKASKKKPFEVYANDFDENGTLDIVLSYKKSGTQVPLRGKECSSQQVPAIKLRFKTYDLFADASLADIYGQHMLDQSLHYEANTFSHVWIENKGNGKFEQHKLPIYAQFSSINAIMDFDYNQDGLTDLILGGNLYQAEVETPRADAGIGLVLTGNKEGEFEVVPPAESKLMIEGEVKQIQPIQLADGSKAFIFARNDDSLRIYRLNYVN